MLDSKIDFVSRISFRYLQFSVLTKIGRRSRPCSPSCIPIWHCDGSKPFSAITGYVGKSHKSGIIATSANFRGKIIKPKQQSTMAGIALISSFILIIPMGAARAARVRLDIITAAIKQPIPRIKAMPTRPVQDIPAPNVRS
jgi:hypothetical protein